MNALLHMTSFNYERRPGAGSADSSASPHRVYT